MGGCDDVMTFWAKASLKNNLKAAYKQGYIYYLLTLFRFRYRNLIVFFYRELSGAHIEVEKQSKGQGDRTILIKGTLPYTAGQHQLTWFFALILYKY